ncbi:MAG TPA: preprotein translocase subunit SecG [Planctomycetaceae bacterium]|nr:preprotein translocase subunit SecG [Planctomycetaceae bacterium]
MLLALASHYFFGITIFVTSVFLILLVLVQRGRGGGIAGALGGAGGQSAFGTKAGDLFTRITVGVATVWILLCCLAILVLKDKDFSTGVTDDAKATVASGVGSSGTGGTTDAAGNANAVGPAEATAPAALETTPAATDISPATESAPATKAAPATEAATASGTESAAGTEPAADNTALPVPEAPVDGQSTATPQ